MEREQHKDFTWVDKALAASWLPARPWDGKNGKRSDISWSAEGNLSHHSVYVPGSHAVPSAG